MARRALALSLMVGAATAGFGYGRWDAAAAGAALAIGIYAVLPRPKLPPGALHAERLPSVYMPDLVALLLATTFLALPFIVSAHEDWLEGPWALMLMTWPPGLIALAIFWVAIGYQCCWVTIGPDALLVGQRRGITVVPYAQIARVSGETTRVPRWLGPALALLGGWRGAGVALVADRPSHRLVIERKDAPPLRLPADAFPDLRRLLGALREAGVPVGSDLAGGRRARKSRKGKSDGRKIQSSGA